MPDWNINTTTLISSVGATSRRRRSRWSRLIALQSPLLKPIVILIDRSDKVVSLAFQAIPILDQLSYFNSQCSALSVEVSAKQSR